MRENVDDVNRPERSDLEFPSSLKIIGFSGPLRYETLDGVLLWECYTYTQ